MKISDEQRQMETAFAVFGDSTIRMVACWNDTPEEITTTIHFLITDGEKEHELMREIFIEKIIDSEE